ncbi:hypothetical protein BDB00DRAFT_936198 [Zychaea mexicana]|uniref:uncharacterized protein n=1 Tax=Zychaea mexicana TaxID=64656 RepID=UPI0022FF3A58|nr:uncharacterized protein BDB00DRAFT_936198 [Zychaea mexicana]KAI9497333.1 hypothetical protein BDB00DRAFT_936198 [Zychaea mexicana]
MQHRPLAQLLTRAESCYKIWSQQHARSVSLLITLSNVVAQRTAATANSNNDAFESIDTSRLVYKQSLAFESIIDNLNRVVDGLESILFDLQKLESDAAKWVTKETATTIKSREPAPLSTETLIQVAAIQPHDVHRYIADVLHMLRKDFENKQTWIDELPLHSSRPEQLEDLIQQWDQQTHVRRELVEEMSERIKLYKQVYKVVTSTD